MNSPELIRLDLGSQIPDALIKLANERKWQSAICAGIGGVSDVELAYYDLEKKTYLPFSIDGIVELVALNGNLTGPPGEPLWHLHALVADRTGRTYGGHLVACAVALTLELAVWPMQNIRTRTFEENTGLRLLSE